MAFNCDHLRLEDTKLILEVACDLIVYGNKVMLSIENLVRDGMGQSLAAEAQVYRQPIERLQHAVSVKALGVKVVALPWVVSVLVVSRSALQSQSRCQP